MFTPTSPRPPVRRAAARGITGVVLLIALSGCAAPPTPGNAGAADAGPPAPRAQVAAPGAALGALGTLPVKGRAPMSGYDRDVFGPEWLDADRNGCDTRNDLLARHLVDRVHDPTTRGCAVVSGWLLDPYTGASVRFVKGDGTAVDIDHVVSLGNAWATGAQAWPIRKRAALANDPLNLLPVDAGANRQKGDADAATWLPPNKGFRCRYVARQVAVKVKYGLWVTAAESAAIRRLLAGCPGQRLPRDSGAPLRVPVALPSPDGPREGAVRFENCAAAAAAGAAPVRRGQPGYGPHLDGDGDGSGCE